jgi:hypothetical protein
MTTKITMARTRLPVDDLVRAKRPGLPRLRIIIATAAAVISQDLLPHQAANDNHVLQPPPKSPASAVRRAVNDNNKPEAPRHKMLKAGFAKQTSPLPKARDVKSVPTSNGKRFQANPRRECLKFKFSRLGEGEAEGRYAITALVVTIAIRGILAAGVATLAGSFALKAALKVLLP